MHGQRAHYGVNSGVNVEVMPYNYPAGSHLGVNNYLMRNERVSSVPSNQGPIIGPLAARPLVNQQFHAAQIHVSPLDSSQDLFMDIANQNPVQGGDPRGPIIAGPNIQNVLGRVHYSNLEIIGCMIPHQCYQSIIIIIVWSQ